MSLKIIKLAAENVKRLKAIEIIPDGSMVKISGKNGAGKTSVLDSILYALAGKASIPGIPIREGEESAHIEVNLGDYIVTRRFTQGGSTLTVENAEGAIFKSPQSMLDNMIGKLSFDPMLFMHKSSRDQFEELIDIVGLDLSKLDSKRKDLFDERTMVNREGKSLKQQVVGIEKIKNPPKERIDIAKLAHEIRMAEDNNGSIDDLKDELAENKETVAEICNKISHLQSTLEDFEMKSKQIRKELSVMKPADTEKLQDKLDGSNESNDLYVQHQANKALTKALKVKVKESIKLSEKIAQIDHKKALKLEKTEFPVSGLSLGEGVVVYNEVPLDQASAAEQLRVSVGIAMASNPDIRIIRITDASLLDSNSMKIISDLAEEKDFQVWLEIVDESGKIGFVIEEGEVVKVNKK